MINVRVKFYSNLKNTFGLKEDIVSIKKNSSFDDLFKFIVKKAGITNKNVLISEEGNYKFIVVLNEKKISNLKNLSLEDGDTILFIPPIAGG